MHNVLSAGQTDLQVVASGRKLNLRRDLHWEAKRTHKFPPKYMQVTKKTDWDIFINNRLMDVTQLALTLVGWPNGEKLATPISQLGASYTTRQIYFFT